MGIAVFDYAVWSARFPALALTTSSGLATSLFGEACLFLDNTDCSPVVDVNARLALLNLIVAHLAVINGTSGSGLVGRINSAQEGTVKVETDYGNVKNQSEAYWTQTPYGAQYWAMTLPYRSATYVEGPVPYLGVPGSGYLGMFGWPR